MPNRKASPPSNSSRTAAKVAVAILVVIAIAGVVLTSLRSRTPGAGADATQQAASALTAASAAPEADAGGPNGVVFAPGSNQLSSSASAKLQALAETARKEKRTVVIQARFELGTDSGERMALARKRTIAVRQVFEDNGVASRNLLMEISQVPAGALAAGSVNRVLVEFRGG